MVTVDRSRARRPGGEDLPGAGSHTVAGMADQAGAIRQRLASALTAALKGRDAIAVSALRSALAAIDNASAVPAGPAPAVGTGSPHFAGAVAGVGAAEAQRRHLSETEIEEIVRTEVAER